MSANRAAEIAATTVYRNKEGKRVSRSELLQEKAKEKRIKTPEELEKEHFDWNVDTATKRQQRSKLLELKKFETKSFTQYKSDKEYNDRLKEELRPDDPMYEYFLSKQQEEEEQQEKEKEKNMKNNDEKPIVDDYRVEPTKPKYRGPTPAPNRFDILPGYRWDGISRGNGYEAKRILRSNVTKMRNQEAYMWSVANL